MPFGSIIIWLYWTSPTNFPPSSISTILQSTFPSTKPFTITLSAVINPFIFPFFPIVTTPSQKILPSTKPSIWTEPENFSSPFI